MIFTRYWNKKLKVLDINFLTGKISNSFQCPCSYVIALWAPKFCRNFLTKWAPISVKSTRYSTELETVTLSSILLHPTYRVMQKDGTRWLQQLVAEERTQRERRSCWQTDGRKLCRFFSWLTCSFSMNSPWS